MNFTSSADRKAAGLIIFQRDRACFQFLLWAPTLLVMTLVIGVVYYFLIQEEGAITGTTLVKMGLPFVGGLVLSGVIALLGVRRIRHIRRVVDEGRRIEAIFTEVYYSPPWPISKDLKAVFKLKYVLDEQTYESTSVMVRRRETLGFEPGMKVIVAVDAAKPDEAFIVELFLEPKRYV